MQVTRDLRNRRFWRGLTLNGLAALGALSAVLGLFDLFWPDRLDELSLPLKLVVPVVAALWAAWRSWPYPVEQHYSSPDTKIRLVTGDLFEQDMSLVIGMSDCFDIETPNIIATSSVQGQFLRRVYHDDVNVLRAELAAALVGKEIVESGVAKAGNTERYKLGTVATLRRTRTHFYCLAYTTMDANNNVSSSTGILWDAFESLWGEVRSRSNGEKVAAPIIGQGQSGMSTVLPIRDALRFMILSFMFASRRAKVCDELVIVVRPEDERRLDMLEAQDFLDSLRKSS